MECFPERWICSKASTLPSLTSPAFVFPPTPIYSPFSPQSMTLLLGVSPDVLLLGPFLASNPVYHEAHEALPATVCGRHARSDMPLKTDIQSDGSTAMILKQKRSLQAYKKEPFIIRAIQRYQQARRARPWRKRSAGSHSAQYMSLAAPPTIAIPVAAITNTATFQPFIASSTADLPPELWKIAPVLASL